MHRSSALRKNIFPRGKFTYCKHLEKFKALEEKEKWVGKILGKRELEARVLCKYYADWKIKVSKERYFVKFCILCMYTDVQTLHDCVQTKHMKM